MMLAPLPPYDFELSCVIFSDGDVQVRNYENGVFWQVIRVCDKLLLMTVTNAGRVEKPKLAVKLECKEEICPRDKAQAKEILCMIFNLNFDLKPFYEHMKTDSVMERLTRELRGLKSPTTPTVFEALIDSIVEQQISLKIANRIEHRVTKRFGDVLKLDKRVYYAYPTSRQLASASVRRLRNCGLSRRKAEFIRDVSEMDAESRLSLEKLKDNEGADEIIAELDSIRGVGPWTAELTMVRGMNRLEAFPADDVGLRRVVSHYYCNDEKMSGQEARRIAEKWGPWKGLAGFYLIVASAKKINP
jgi:DNA-3-methyladenine glycosylase II